MFDSFVDWRKAENICPVVLVGKEKYYLDLMNIEHSWTGRMDVGNRVTLTVHIIHYGQRLISRQLWCFWRICLMMKEMLF